MSLKKGLAVFGASAAVFAGGGASAHEAFNKAEKLAIERDCASPEPVDERVCESIITTSETRSIAMTERDVYGILGFVGLMGGAFGIAAGGVITVSTREGSQKAK